MAKLKLWVEGIECLGCALDVETVLLRIEGVTDVRVNYQKETLTVEYNTKEITDEQILSAIRKMGFKVTAGQKAI